MTKEELEDRLVNFSVMALDIADFLPNTKTGNHIAGQMIRTSTSPAFNYGEAKDAESTNDFIHKIKIILKELRETFIALKIIKKANLLNDYNDFKKVYQENNELIAIFVSTVKTARQKQRKQ